jgi:hypothetical protein
VNRLADVIVLLRGNGWGSRVRTISTAIELLVLVAALCLQLYVWRTVATDFHGDPVDYVGIARSLWSSNHGGVSFIRFPGFPLFIWLTSWDFHHLQVTFLVQSLLFMIALVYFARSLASHPLLRVVLYIPALLPTVAYAQKLLFPDGLILSLLLLFTAAIAKRRPYAAAVIAALFVVVKVVFISLFLVLLAIEITRRGVVSRRIAVLLLPVGIVALWIAVYLAFPLVIYQTTIQIPTFVKAPNDLTDLADGGLSIKCRGHKIRIAKPSVLSQVRVQSASDLTPIGPELARQLGCSTHDVADLQRHLIVREIKSDPTRQVQNLGDRVVRAAFVMPQTSHIGYMLTQKAALLEASSGRARNRHYDDLETGYFKDVGVTPPPVRGNPHWLLHDGLNFDSTLRRVLTDVSIVTAALALLLGFYDRALAAELFPLATLGLVYSVVVGLFAFVYDRYVLINYFLWLGALVMISSFLTTKFVSRSQSSPSAVGAPEPFEIVT